MAKVLVSFLGAALDGYKSANYRFSDGKVITSTFIAEALSEYHQIDKMVLIGTAHSMWDEIYDVLGRDDIENKEYIRDHLKEVCKASNHVKSELTQQDIKSIEEGLGDNAKVIIIKYGLDNKEIAFNTKEIFKLEEFLENGDHLYLDITHSFRSLPIYLINCLIYLKNVCDKNLVLESISYGMLDVSREFPSGKKVSVGDKEVDEFLTPVVELKKILDVQDWIIGAYNFKEFGNTYKIASLLEKDESGRYGSVATNIKEFADVKNINYLNLYMNSADALQRLAKGDELPDMGKMVISPVMKDFVAQFPSGMRQSRYQFRMAKWHNARHNYGYALMLLVESVVSFTCEACRVDPNVRTKREWAKEVMKDYFEMLQPQDKKRVKKKYFGGVRWRMEAFCNEYIYIKEIRNKIAHNNPDLDMSSSQIVDAIENGLEFFNDYIDHK